MNLKSWLRRTPPPAVILVDGGKRITIGESPRKWTDAVNTIEAMGATRIEALAADGSTIRAMTLDDSEEKATDESDKTNGASDLQVFAKLLMEAYKCGATSNDAPYRLAFEQNTALVSAMSARLSGMEVAWQKAMVGTAKLQAALASAGAGGEEGEMDMMGLMGLMMGGGPQGQAATAAARAAAASVAKPKTNGANGASKKAD